MKRDHCNEPTLFGPGEDGRGGKRKPSRRLTAIIPLLQERGTSLSKRHSHLLVDQLGSFKETPNILSVIRTASWALMVALWMAGLRKLHTPELGVI